MLKRLWRPPENVDIWPADDDIYYKSWGFTIYRTCYDPGSEQQWNLLIEKISTSVHAGIKACECPTDTASDISKLYNLFKLDARSSPDLDGLTRAKICQIYRDAVGGAPMEMMTSLTPDYPIFLLADEEVLRDPDFKILKVVQSDYRAFAYDGLDAPFYLDWMTMHPGSVVDFWDELEDSDHGLADFLPSKVPGAFWEPW